MRLDRGLLATLCIVSEVHVKADRDGHVVQGQEHVVAEKSPHPKCERCWNYRLTVGLDPDHPTLCERCAAVVSQ